MIKRAAALKAAGVNIVVLLALSDDGAASFERRVARQLAALVIPSFACTPAKFPKLMRRRFRSRSWKCSTYFSFCLAHDAQAEVGATFTFVFR